MSTDHQQNDVAKLKTDLGVVEEKINLCRSMLPKSKGIKDDPALAKEIGFLVSL